GQLDAHGLVRGWYDGVVETVISPSSVRLRVRYGLNIWRLHTVDPFRFLVKQEDSVRRCLAPPDGYWRLMPSFEQPKEKIEIGAVISLRDEVNPFFSYDAVVLGYAQDSNGLTYVCGLRDAQSYFETYIPANAIAHLQPFVFARRTV